MSRKEIKNRDFLDEYFFACQCKSVWLGLGKLAFQRNQMRSLRLFFLSALIGLPLIGCAPQGTGERIAVSEAAFTPEPPLPRDRIQAMRTVLTSVGGNVPVEPDNGRPVQQFRPASARSVPLADVSLDQVSFLPVQTARPAVSQAFLEPVAAALDMIETGSSPTLGRKVDNN